MTKSPLTNFWRESRETALGDKLLHIEEPSMDDGHVTIGVTSWKHCNGNLSWGSRKWAELDGPLWCHRSSFWVMCSHSGVLDSVGIRSRGDVVEEITHRRTVELRGWHNWGGEDYLQCLTMAEGRKDGRGRPRWSSGKDSSPKWGANMSSYFAVVLTISSDLHQFGSTYDERRCE